MTTVERVGVVGCGLMGSGIAEVCARAGLDVIVREVDAGAAEAGQKRLADVARPRRAQLGKLTEDERDAAARPRCGSPPTSASWPTASWSSRRWSRTRR